MEISTLELVKLAQNNDEIAKERLMIENSPLIKSVIKRYKNKGVEYEDLYQLGSLGFLKAINNFDESFNVKFSTYAVPMIAGEIKRFMRDNGIIKVSRSVKALNIQITKFNEEYINEHNISPTIDEIAHHFNVSSEDIIFAMESNIPPLSLSSIVSDEDSNKEQMLIEKIAENDMEGDMDLFLISNIIKTMPKRDKKIILLRYFRDKTQKEVAEMLGVSQVQVSRLENKILKAIRNSVEGKEVGISKAK